MRKLTRRQAVAYGSTTLVGAGTALALSSERTRAEGVTVDTFDVSDVQHVSPDGMVEDVLVEVTAAYAFETTTDITDVRLELRAGRSEDSTTEIAAVERPESGTDGTGETVLDGPLTYSQDFELADFRPLTSGELVVQDVTFELRVTLLSNSDEIDTAAVFTTNSIEVTNQDDVLELSVGGSGTVTLSG